MQVYCHLLFVRLLIGSCFRSGVVYWARGARGLCAVHRVLGGEPHRLSPRRWEMQAAEGNSCVFSKDVQQLA